MRTYTSGLAMMTALCHDHVARYNIRRSRTAAAAEVDITTDFDVSTHGSHHLRLVDSVARLWNKLLKKDKNSEAAASLRALPIFKNIDSKEHFGLVPSDHSTSFGGLLQIKDEPKAEDELFEVVEKSDDDVVGSLLDDLNINPILLSYPEDAGSCLPSTSTSGVASKTTADYIHQPLPLVLANAPLKLDRPSVPLTDVRGTVAIVECLIRLVNQLQN